MYSVQTRTTTQFSTYKELIDILTQDYLRNVAARQARIEGRDGYTPDTQWSQDDVGKVFVHTETNHICLVSYYEYDDGSVYLSTYPHKNAEHNGISSYNISYSKKGFEPFDMEYADYEFIPPSGPLNPYNSDN